MMCSLEWMWTEANKNEVAEELKEEGNLQRAPGQGIKDRLGNKAEGMNMSDLK